jgi:hypothetical protein
LIVPPVRIRGVDHAEGHHRLAEHDNPPRSILARAFSGYRLM